jgi:hypothetical protein
MLILTLVLRLKLMVGNGMRPEVWEPFAVRFNVPRIGMIRVYSTRWSINRAIGEFYASTEGNVALWNTLGETGAVGYVPPMVRMMSPYTIVKYDVDKDEIVRDSKGFAIKCNYDEVRGNNSRVRCINGCAARRVVGANQPR